jgi:hypothetical protein
VVRSWKGGMFLVPEVGWKRVEWSREEEGGVGWGGVGYPTPSGRRADGWCRVGQGRAG